MDASLPHPETGVVKLPGHSLRTWDRSRRAGKVGRASFRRGVSNFWSNNPPGDLQALEVIPASSPQDNGLYDYTMASIKTDATEAADEENAVSNVVDQGSVALEVATCDEPECIPAPDRNASEANTVLKSRTSKENLAHPTPALTISRDDESSCRDGARFRALGENMACTFEALPMSGQAGAGKRQCARPSEGEIDPPKSDAKPSAGGHGEVKRRESGIEIDPQDSGYSIRRFATRATRGHDESKTSCGALASESRAKGRAGGLARRSFLKRGKRPKRTTASRVERILASLPISKIKIVIGESMLYVGGWPGCKGRGLWAA